MSEIDKKYLDVAILSMLAHSSMNSAEILLELNQQGSDLQESAVKFEIDNLSKSNLIIKDCTNPGKYVINEKGRKSLGNLLSLFIESY